MEHLEASKDGSIVSYENHNRTTLVAAAKEATNNLSMRHILCHWPPTSRISHTTLLFLWLARLRLRVECAARTKTVRESTVLHTARTQPEMLIYCIRSNCQIRDRYMSIGACLEFCYFHWRHSNGFQPRARNTHYVCILRTFSNTPLYRDLTSRRT
jgi:hypothetical protein